MATRPLLLGHRGARSEKSPPENTFAAFDFALASGCDGFRIRCPPHGGWRGSRLSRCSQLPSSYLSISRATSGATFPARSAGPISELRISRYRIKSRRSRRDRLAVTERVSSGARIFSVVVPSASARENSNPGCESPAGLDLRESVSVTPLAAIAGPIRHSTLQAHEQALDVQTKNCRQESFRLDGKRSRSHEAHFQNACGWCYLR